LLIDAKIIILDESTSSLDAVTESHVQDILQNELGGRTVIIIAHRLATVRHCDRIIVLENGTIKEDGPHARLMEKEGVYAELVHHQFSM
jgi:ABC-type multidrug transport system fused ATPase/permease subunit